MLSGGIYVSILMVMM